MKRQRHISLFISRLILFWLVLGFLQIFNVPLGIQEAAAQQVTIIGSWVSGTTHTAESGTNRALIFTAHTESSTAGTNLASVTYGGQAMTKIVDWEYFVSYNEYTAAFILDEAGIAAATTSTFVVTWGTAPDGTPAFSSVFLSDVNQSSLVGDTGTGGSTVATAETTPLSTNSGDMAFVAGTCGNTGTYSTINGFTAAIELAPSSADGVCGYLAATGGSVTPGVSHTNVNRQSVIGFVVQPVTAVNQAPVLDPIGNQSVNEGQLLQFTVTASDPDPGDTLTYSATNLPTGASFDPLTQIFTWAPDFGQEGSYPNVTFTVTDDGTPVESDSEAITITVIGPTANWGDDAQNGTATTTAHSRAMGGTSPDIDNVEIQSISIYLGAQTGDVRLAVYTGGALDNPTAATLLWDAGTVNPNGIEGWYTINHPAGGVSWPRNTVTWLAWKRNTGVAVYYSTSSADAGDFQTARGRHNNNFSQLPGDAFPSTYGDIG
jgi:hypothetical protein